MGLLLKKIRHNAQARNAWRYGFPEARSIEHAETSWAPHMSTWTQWVSQGKYLGPWSRWRTFHARQPHYQMAWITHEPFWKALAQYSSTHFFAWWPEITREAAVQANLAALRHIPGYYRQACFLKVQDGHETTHPRSVKWAESMGFLKPASRHLEHWTLESPLNTSPWNNGYQTLNAHQRGSYNMAQWCLAAHQCGELTTDQAVGAVGHCMRLCQYHGWGKSSLEWQWFENTVRPAYSALLDWDMLAALHGIPLPAGHPWFSWSSSLVAIGRYAANQGVLTHQTLQDASTDPVLQFLLDSNRPRSIREVYSIVQQVHELPSIDVLDLPPDWVP